MKKDQDRSWQDVYSSRGLDSWNIKALINYYNQNGSGIFSLYNGFYWNGSSLESIKETDPITLDKLIGYDVQKQILLDNTEKFVSGHPLTMSCFMGTRAGKSSMVKA